MSSRRLYYVLFAIMLVFSSVMFTGCVSIDETYDALTNENSSDVGGSDGGLYEGMTKSESYVFSILVSAYKYLRSFLVAGICSSFLFGVFLRLAIKKSKKIRRTATFTFMFGIPLFLVVVFYMMAFYLNRYI